MSKTLYYVYPPGIRAITYKRVMFVSCSRTDGKGPDKVFLLMVLQNKEKFGGLLITIKFHKASRQFTRLQEIIMTTLQLGIPTIVPGEETHRFVRLVRLPKD